MSYTSNSNSYTTETPSFEILVMCPKCLIYYPINKKHKCNSTAGDGK